jgi:excinuclease ABC subunit B
VRGQAILYADNMTDSMERAISETERRRKIQIAYNKEHNITPTPIIKRSNNAILQFLEVSRRLTSQELEQAFEQADDLPLDTIPDLIVRLEAEMKEAAKKLEFEEAAKLRDRIKHLRDRMLGKRS